MHSRDITIKPIPGWIDSSDIDEVGDYYGLVIGIDKYGPEEWKLRCAVKDASAVAERLREDCGFELVEELYDHDATEKAILRKLHELAGRVSERDSVLVYYAGHGTVEGATSYWIPVDGEPGQRWTYIPHLVVRDIVSSENMPARHVLIVNDSCYAQGMLRDARLPREATPAYVKQALKTPSRQCLTSGGMYPVPDGPTGGHSFFAKCFLRALESFHRDVFVPSDIMKDLKENVGLNAPPVDGQPQVPILGHLVQAGGLHDGEFVFIRRRDEPPPPPPPVLKWHYLLDGEKQGPVDEAALGQLAASGRLKREDLVWCADLSNWTAAGQVAELTHLFPKPPPPPPPLPPPPVQPKVHFESQPPGADVVIDGSRRGRTPLELRIDAGDYQVTFELSDHEPKTGTLRVQPGQDARLRMELEREIMLPSGLVLPSGTKDRYGNPVRQGTDPDSGLPLEVCLERVGMPMVLCPAGVFKMGGEEYDSERPVHQVDVPVFYMAKYQVSNRQWKQFVDANPDWRKDRIDEESHDGNYLDHWWVADCYPLNKADHPVMYVSWSAAKAFAEWAGGRLPTEAEWEKACRAGMTTTYCFGDDESQLGEYAWYNENSDDETHPVGQKKANAWGLYDLHGNVWEWCSSKEESYPYHADDGREELSDPGSPRALRGGSFFVLICHDGYVINCRAASRYHCAPRFCGSGRGVRFCLSAAAPK